MALRVLSVAVATGRIGYVFMYDGQLRDWGLSRKASGSTRMARKQVCRWFDQLNPDIVVTEDPSARSRKGVHAKAIMEAIVRVAEKRQIQTITVTRQRVFQNKYDEAARLAGRFPEIAPWVPPKRRIWQSEPRNTIYFEALGFAAAVIDDRSEDRA